MSPHVFAGQPNDDENNSEQITHCLLLIRIVRHYHHDIDRLCVFLVLQDIPLGLASSFPGQYRLFLTLYSSLPVVWLAQTSQDMHFAMHKALSCWSTPPHHCEPSLLENSRSLTRLLELRPLPVHSLYREAVETLETSPVSFWQYTRSGSAYARWWLRRRIGSNVFWPRCGWALCVCVLKSAHIVCNLLATPHLLYVARLVSTLRNWAKGSLNGLLGRNTSTIDCKESFHWDVLQLPQ